MIAVFAWFGTITGRLVTVAAVISALVGLRAFDVSKQRAVGEERAVARIEKATDNAVKIGRQAARKSSAPVAATERVRGARDPTTRND